MDHADTLHFSVYLLYRKSTLPQSWIYKQTPLGLAQYNVYNWIAENTISGLCTNKGLFLLIYINIPAVFVKATTFPTLKFSIY
jgi:hypothetical protein